VIAQVVRMNEKKVRSVKENSMFTKIKENGKLNLLKTLKFNMGFSTSKKNLIVRGSAMRTMPNGAKRKAYDLTNKF